MALAVAVIGAAFFFILNLITDFALPALAVVTPVLLLLTGAMVLEQKKRRLGWSLIGVAVLLGCFAWPWANMKFFVEARVPQPHGSQSSWKAYYEALDEAGFTNVTMDVRGGLRSPQCRVVTTTPSPGDRMDPRENLRVALDCP